MPSIDLQSLLSKHWLVILMITRHDVFKVMCPVGTTASFLLDSHQHFAGLDNVVDIMVSCLLVFPEMSYVCCYLGGGKNNKKYKTAYMSYLQQERKYENKPNDISSLF